MKIIIKHKPIEIYEGLEVKKENIGTIAINDKIQQRLMHDANNNRYILIEDSQEETESYKSKGHIEVYCKEGDILVGNSKVGYNKPIAQISVINKEQEKYIEEINKLYEVV